MNSASHLRQLNRRCHGAATPLLIAATIYAAASSLSLTFPEYGSAPSVLADDSGRSPVDVWRRLASRRCGRSDLLRSPSCNWTAVTRGGDDGCAVLVRPAAKSNQGVALWISDAVAGHLLAAQHGCGLLIDYGPGVDVGRVLVVPPPDSPSDSRRATPWSVPEAGFECDARRGRCLLASEWALRAKAAGGSHLKLMGKKLDKFARAKSGGLLRRMPARVPSYRSGAYRDAGPDPADYRGLAERVPGFRLETGAACSLTSLFELAPSAEEYVPGLFNRILPALRDKDALVLALYLRTGWTDEMAALERAGNGTVRDAAAATELPADLDVHVENIVRCALNLEEMLHREGGALPSSSPARRRRTTWLVVTDSPSVGRAVALSRRALDREVLLTSTSGVQTRPSRRPSTSDFAQAIVDWYVLGEADAIVGGGQSNRNETYSFAFMAAMRMNRPLYDSTDGMCERWKFVRNSLDVDDTFSQCGHKK